MLEKMTPWVLDVARRAGALRRALGVAEAWAGIEGLD
jgi:hypothetical protein